MKCKDCRFYNRGWPEGFGRCALDIFKHSSWEPDEGGGDKVRDQVHILNPCCGSTILVGENFGCIHHEDIPMDREYRGESSEIF